jgi:hypothetical protein
MSTGQQPTRPKSRPEAGPDVTPENERIVRERLKTFDQDAKTAEDWSVVRARVLQLKPLS